jgi:hypothetical protein
MKEIIIMMLLLIASASAFAAEPGDQDPASRKLLEAIERADKAMFDAFKAHELDLLMSMFTSDVEFYHDKVG